MFTFSIEAALLAMIIARPKTTELETTSTYKINKNKYLFVYKQIKKWDQLS